MLHHGNYRHDQGPHWQMHGTFTNSVLLTVDYEKSFDERVADGHYDQPDYPAYPNGNFNGRNYPIGHGRGAVEFEVQLFYFRPTHFQTDFAAQEIEDLRQGIQWQNAGTEHMLAFGAKFPEEQRAYDIWALRSRCVSGRTAGYVARLCTREKQRWIMTCGWHNRKESWKDRFLAVRPLLRT